jgi:hypothetical protein
MTMKNVQIRMWYKTAIIYIWRLYSSIRTERLRIKHVMDTHLWDSSYCGRVESHGNSLQFPEMGQVNKT